MCKMKSANPDVMMLSENGRLVVRPVGRDLEPLDQDRTKVVGDGRTEVVASRKKCKPR